MDAEAPGTPFDNGHFEVIVEPLDAEEPGPLRSPQELVQLERRRPQRMPAAVAVEE